MGDSGRMSDKFVIGDIHGCYDELMALFTAIQPKSDDTVILLGDYIDRGANSMAVLDAVLELKNTCNVIALRGNHEAMMINAFTEHNHSLRLKALAQWCLNGGLQTMQSYMFDHNELIHTSNLNDVFIPKTLQSHIDFIKNMPTYHIDDTHIYVHASPRLDTPIAEQDEVTLLWRRPNKADAKKSFKHMSGKTVVSGHTAQKNGKPLDLGGSIIIDSGCYATGWLTSMAVNHKTFIQADKHGNIRSFK